MSDVCKTIAVCHRCLIRNISLSDERENESLTFNEGELLRKKKITGNITMFCMFNLRYLSVTEFL